MDFDIDRSIGQPGANTRVSLELSEMIIAALDRDSDLRRDYLRKLWQGVVI